MVYPTCKSAQVTFHRNETVRCSSGWVMQKVPDASNGSGSIDYMSSGQYFGAAFTVAAVIVLTAKVAARLLNFIRK